MQSLKVNEIFYSLQGEGLRAGEPSIFIRLAGCTAKNSCFKSGILCDTEFESYIEMTIDEIKKEIEKYPCHWIVWTGGEPTDQLTEEIVMKFHKYKHAIECSGIRQAPENIDFVTISPKVGEHILERKWKHRMVDEIKYVRHKGQGIPEPKILAKNYYLSPHSDGFNINYDNVSYCIKLCLDNPKWKMSIQQHKIWNVR